MPDSHHQTVRIRHGRHASPAHGACVIEVASMLAGERFSDHPRTVCPVLAGFLRSYNDLVPDRQLDELYPYAAVVVGTAASASVRRQRARRLLEWAGLAPRSLMLWLGPWDPTLLPAAKHALTLEPETRRAQVGALLEELAAMGRQPDVPTAAAPPERPEGLPAGGSERAVASA